MFGKNIVTQIDKNKVHQILNYIKLLIVFTGMKKIYSLLIALVAMFCSAVAINAASLTVNVDDASRVKVMIDYVEQTIVTGNNVFEYDPNSYAYMEISGKNGDYGISKVHVKYTDNTKEDVYMSYGKAGLSMGAYQNGAVYTVTSFSYAELRTATCTVNVDDASKVSFQRGNSTVELVNGDNTIAFIPDGSNAESFSIRGTSGSLYQVLVNGTAASTSYDGSYSVSPKANDIIKIEANFPDVNVPVKFIAVNEGTEGFVTNVKVDGEAVANAWDEHFSVKLGSTLEWTPNESDYQLNSIWLNGATSYLYECRNITVLTTDSVIIKYDATKYASFNITVNIDHADRITLYKKVNYNSVEITGLVDGANTIELSEACSGLSFKAFGGCWVKSFKDAEGTEYKDYPDNYQDIPVAEGKVFTVTTGAVERNAKFVFYIDEPAQCPYGGNLTLAADNHKNQTTPVLFQDGNGDPLAGGYYTIAFDATFDNPMQINCWGNTNAAIVYQQDTIVKYDYSPRFTATDGDVIKVFLAGAPDTLAVTFTAAAGCAFSDVVRDIVVPVADVTTPLEVLEGTQISFKQTGAVKVLANGAEVAADEDGVYTISVTADTEIVASDDSVNALENTDAEVKATKILENGQIFILKNNVKYNILGTVVK